MRRELVRRTARGLGAAGIPVMPMKGVLFAYWIYEDPRARGGCDVDLLVPDQQFERAIRTLASRGFAAGPRHANLNERSLVTRQLPMEVDLHRAYRPQARRGHTMLTSVREGSRAGSPRGAILRG